MDLVRFINEKYCKLNGIDEQVNGGCIRSERSCQLDFRRWGAKFEANAQRPYFEGHEKDDVVKHRNDFINYFLEHKDFYRTITDGEAPAWSLPVKSRQRIIICSGDVDYVERTATASINIGSDAYFNNETILNQFERLFQMLEFKQHYKKHQIDIIVDNARTHTAKAYSLQDFRKSVGGHCTVDCIEYLDEDGNPHIIDCYFKDGANKGKSKGLVEICKDLGIQLPPKIKLEEIRELLPGHPAFQNATKLETFALKYKVNVIFCPKYHCELNAIEGFWYSQKAFVRSRTDQAFEKMIKLISESRAYFVERSIALKLFRRCWHAVEAHSQGQTYGEVFKLFFSQLCSASVQSHRRISNDIINDD
ncbi:unnamed protein product [Adineta ricciae]|uniref:Uncharacterized protein n=1 Tax=Adineta ricciae TaxID=249248 RepID=A0A815GG92_ADIRI|nr:unnamed protein product [Adineta ricciae]CAF1662264.1 unnamed protein product [Adineta ricciae]